MDTFTGTLYPHQSAGLAFLQAQPRGVLADDVGLGKTVQLAALVGHLADSGQLRKPGRLPVLWVTTAGLVAQTTAEVRRFLPSVAVTTSETGAKGTRAGRERVAAFRRAHPDGPDVLVTNHDLAHRRRDHLADLRPSLVIVDEASALKGAGARFGALSGLCETAERAVASTATPFENDPLELWAVLALVGIPGIPSAERFGADYCQFRTFDDGTRKCTGWLSPQHARQVMAWLGPRFVRRTAENVGLSLPVRVDSGHVLVPLSTSQLAEYERAGWISHALTRHQRQAKAARRGSDGLSTVIAAASAAAIVEARQGRKVVVYAEHLDDLDDLSRRLTAAGVGHACLRGENTGTERTDAVSQFENDEGTPVLVGSKVLEHGLNLQFAHVLISAGQSYNPARERQREGRLCRIGSPNATYRHLVYLPDTHQTRQQLATLSHKAAQAAPVLLSSLLSPAGRAIPRLGVRPA